MTLTAVRITSEVVILQNYNKTCGHLCTSRTHLNFAIITVFLPTFDFVNSINYNHLAHIYVL